MFSCIALFNNRMAGDNIMSFIEKKNSNQQYIIDMINTYRMTIRKVLSYRLYSPTIQDL